MSSLCRKSSLTSRSCADYNQRKPNFIQIQAVILEGIFPIILEVLSKGEHRTRKEAAWALSNAACGGNNEQLRYGRLCFLQSCLCTNVRDAPVAPVFELS